VEGRSGSIRTREVPVSKWPELEEKLYELFLQERDQVSGKSQNLQSFFF
jgi:hypothetical protein